MDAPYSKHINFQLDQIRRPVSGSIDITSEEDFSVEVSPVVEQSELVAGHSRTVTVVVPPLVVTGNLNCQSTVGCSEVAVMNFDALSSFEHSEKTTGMIKDWTSPAYVHQSSHTVSPDSDASSNMETDVCAGSNSRSGISGSGHLKQSISTERLGPVY